MVLSLADQQRIEGLEYEIVQLKDEVNKYKFQGSTGLVGNQTLQSGFLQSSNFVQSSSGFRLTADGIIYAVGAVISGSITATSGTIGGWSINATSIFTGTEDHTGYTANAGDMTFYSDGSDSSIHAFNWYIDTTGTFNARSGSIDGVTISGIPNSTATDISLLDYTHTLVFSATDNDTVAWASGTITMSNGRTFSITGANTSNMSALTWIYLDTAVSSTLLQTTTTAASAMGANKIAIAIAQNNADASANATFVVHKGTTGVALTASSIKTATLSAITADLGSITAGTVTGATLRTSSSNPKFNMTSTVFQGLDTSGDVVFEVIIDGADVGDVTMGDDATGSYAKWDNSAGTFNVFADNVPTTTQGFFGGDGSDGALTITSGTTTVSAGSAATLVKNYSSISITSTGKLDFSNPHANGTTVILKSQGNVTLTSTAPCISTVGMGAAGGAAVTSGGTSGDGLPGSDGKSFSFYLTNNGVNGTGGGGAGAGGAIASFEAVKVNDALGKYMNVIPGAGGGSAGNSGTSGGSPQRTGGVGGRGGGALVLECGGALNFTIAGGITVAGSDGGDGVLTSGAPADWAAGGGGGGGGGVAIVLYNTLTAASGTITVSGGTGGDTGSDGNTEAGGGGGGAVEDAGNTGSSATSGQTGGNGGDGSSLIAKNTLFA